MKKSKLLTTAVLAATLTLSCGLLAACGNDHTHTYSTDWSKDATGHWHVATCDDLKEGDKEYKKDFAAHVWGDDDECDVCKYVKPASPATEISLNKTELALSIAKTEDALEAILNGTGTVTWSSSDETVVQVGEETGAVEALKPGTATITATITGTEIKETCAVTVADAYYVIGGMDSAWTKVAAFGDANVVYFMPTETEGVYKTKSFELPKLGNFQIAPVGDTTGDWYKKAFNGDYIKPDDTVLSKNSGGNIAVEKHGKYTVTLDLTGEKAVVSGVFDEEINDGDVKDIYYIIGSANTTSGWSLATDVAAVGNYVFTENDEDGTHSLTVDLTRGTVFKVAIVGMQWNGALGESAIPRELIGKDNTATVDTDYKLTFTSSDDIGVGLSGKYTFTLDPDGGENNVLSYVFEATEATETAPAVNHYYIKGDALTVENGWNVGTVDAYELKETAADSGVYTITIELKSTGGFMFWASNEDKDGNVTGTQADYFNNGNSTFTAVGNCVTATTNYAPTAAGWYTITLNPETRVLTFSYSATNPNPAE